MPIARQAECLVNRKPGANSYRQTVVTSWSARLGAAFSSLKVRITLGTIAALVLDLGLTTAALLPRAERDILSAHNDPGLSGAVRAAGVLSRRVIALQRALHVVAAQLDKATLADNAKLASFTQSKPVLRELFSSLSAASADGQMRVFADETGMHRPQLNISDRDYFQRTRSEHRAIVSEPLQSRLTRQSAIIFTYPPKDQPGVYGLLGGSLRLTSRDLLGDRVDTRVGESNGLLIVTDAQGRVVAHPNRDRLLQSLATEPRLAEAFRQGVAGGSAAEPSGLRLSQPGELVSAAGVAGQIG